MRTLRYNVAVSLDGFIAPQDESTDWIVEDKTIDFEALYSEFDFFIMGRKTYQVFQAMGKQNPLLGRPKESVVVISRQLNPSQCDEITVLNHGYIEHIKSLREENGRGIWLMGGGWLATACLEASLLDTVEAAIMPVVLSDGFKMIPSSDRKQLQYKLQLQEAQTLDTGIIMAKYRVLYETGN